MPKTRHADDGTSRRTRTPGPLEARPHLPTVTRFLAPGSGVSAHRHDVHQVVYAGRGVLSVTTEAGSWVAPATRAIWIPAGIRHEHRAYGPTVLHGVGLPVHTNPLHLDHPAVLAVGPLLRELLIAYSDPAADPGAPASRRLLAVLVDRLRQAPQQPLHLPTATDPRLAAVCAIFRNDPADPRPLAALGAEAGASARTLTRLFHAEMGMTFPQWRTQLRLHHALLLLADDVPVTAVAHRCGWSSASAFIDVFRRAFGHTPGQRRARTAVGRGDGGAAAEQAAGGGPGEPLSP
ncbi:helix-turn-helix domain-containing protein [Streptomyces sp. YGL11-2]|uniref:helix-turn-helix domain-containing protein n=1 Tax=Streptomyces sp. YGL11-2 TaxID=3414028 RepID=UPI003CED2DD8